jgi:uncharacterized protein YukE
MSQANVSPEELRRFAAELTSINNDIKNNYTRMHDRFRHLSETWRDKEQQKFEQEFNQTIKVINQFIANSEKYVPFLIRKATAAEAYLNAR